MTKGKIVVGVDGSPSSKAALAWAARQATLTGGSLDVVGAWGHPVYYGRVVDWPVDFEPEQFTRQALQDSIDEVIGSGSDVKVRTHVRREQPASALLDEAKDAELLVLGCRGHSEMAGMLLGSVSQHCAAHAQCPVVVIHEH